MINTIQNAEFGFTPDMLATPRKPGISAYLRVRNGAEFVRLAIESHLPFYDEIVAVYNDCSDNTEAILRDLQKRHPQKIKVFHYLPRVAPRRSEAHRNTPTESVHSLANYYNYALSKCSYCIATKLDDDHLAIACNLQPLIERIRADIARGVEKIYYFSGIDLMRRGDAIVAGGFPPRYFPGHGDHYYHPVRADIFYCQGEITQHLRLPDKKTLQREYAGIMYFHVKYMKKDFGFQPSRANDARRAQIMSGAHDGLFVPWDEFCTHRHYKRLMRRFSFLHRLIVACFSSAFVRKLAYAISGYSLGVNKMRLVRLAEDIKPIDFERDALRYLR